MVESEIIKEVISNCRIEIDKVLKEKTGWGRNELKIKLETAYTNAIMETINTIKRNKFD